MAQRQLSPAGPRLQSGVRSQLHCAGKPDKRANNKLIFVPEAASCAHSIRVHFGMHTIIAVSGVGGQAVVLAEHLLVGRHLHDPALVREHLPRALVDRYVHLASNTMNPLRQMRRVWGAVGESLSVH